MNKIEFESLLQSEEFVRVMNKSPLEADQLIEDLCRENPDKVEYIRLAAQLVKYYQTEQIDADMEKTMQMWNNILNNSEVHKPLRTFRITLYWMIAASVALLLSLTFVLSHNFRNDSIRRFAEGKVKVSDEARIILSDGSEHLLKSNDSHIRYESDGKEIVIDGKDDQSEKVSNKQAEEKTVYNQIIVPYGRRHSITLNDGTVVQLNSGSKLVFPAKFAGSKREVYLQGEGYFAVAKDVSKPFIVKTDFMNVKVLGTHFNISAYENENLASAVLVEGSVEVYKNDLFKSDFHKIEPGQGCFFTGTTKEFEIHNVDIGEFVSWKDGFFLIKDQSLENITRKVEKYYNKSISIDDNELANRIISGKLVLTANLEETLDFLARTTRSRYILKEDGNYYFVK